MIEGEQTPMTVSQLADPDRVESSPVLHGLLKDVFVKCTRCQTLMYVRDWERNWKVCNECGYHFRLSAYERIASLVDAGSFVEADTRIRSGDPLLFRSQSQTYPEKLMEAQKRTGLNEAVVSGTGRIAGHALVLAVMDFHFLGGSMGSVVGEKVTRAIELACKERLPLLIVTASGGARMHEGILSLMQMAKTSVALAHLSDARLPFISLLTDPTTGGVTASFAMLGDIILAEPRALIGFAGPRVIEQSTHQAFPANADTSEFVLEHGMIDAIVPRSELRSTIAHILNIYSVRGLEQDKPMHMMRAYHHPLPLPRPIAPAIPANMDKSFQERHGQPDIHPWDRVQLARHPKRPYTEDYIHLMCQSFFAFRGDRRHSDDQAILGGLATFGERTVVIIGHQKGRGVEQRYACNAGMPHPEGCRKAQRLMRHAEKFGFPVICLIDTPGAFPGLEAEQRGLAQAIAESLVCMATLHVPIVSVVIGEGGSGGALALGVADRILMLENSIYTVASPEAAASILWRDHTQAAQAAAIMQMTAPDLLKLGVIDRIIPEPAGGAHFDHVACSRFLASHVHEMLAELEVIPIHDLVEQRQIKFRQFGHFSIV